ncbi:hypothetical protein GCM10029976_041960 [Kribbella albertanoniae]|uniref:GNAT family N-acetyltransferase n=1 Tax=Kribbella albertanoniae TaxID=1266829 RepID=A0A4R4QEU9_9ACTN|nr:GNAT family N-acetyltransferase [Kribbella albertanoniae]TDC33990.1 GNAT family N-acetyltransferase [Kribbella albertanoniae]
MKSSARLVVRPAGPIDLPAIHVLAERAVGAVLPEYYTAAQLSAGRSTQLYHVETELIEDGTYYVLEVDGVLVGGSGWTARGTFHPPGSTSSHGLSVDPDTATMRATYVDPRWAHRGFGRLLAQVTETAATASGYQRFEAMCTPPSESLRLSMGYRVAERLQVPVLDGVTWLAALMRKERQS